ncbi:MAG TPA: cell division protein FtsZ [Chitinophagaceae bacterium]|nr:cell division protein FtsZ [Chitinophagaceae bacterium]
MIQFDLPKQQSSILKVIGVGGGGSNAVNFMYNQNIEGVDFIICNTDAQALAQSPVPNKIQLGPHLTQGLGAGANPEIGKQATEESLDEIRRILEVNTKMAFITAGMGGGTGTGGAPIMAQICRDLGILTVGIVTTPFGFEGPKRQAQAEAGINILKQYVDTLLVISNDKLRVQFGNLKMKDAFTKADNVLATAAKCITDVINSQGQINVDFADVCTVMRNGGVAILGSAAVDGENRAQRAIEEALNSPLLNDNDIRGARWILININSAEGEHEFTMDEVDTIQSYLRSQAGEETDVILGMGYDNSLQEKIGITLVATGFEHKDPFAKKSSANTIKEKVAEKIVMTLGIEGEEKKLYNQAQIPFAEKEKNTIVHTVQEAQTTTETLETKIVFYDSNNQKIEETLHQQSVITSGGYLARPIHIYEEVKINEEKISITETKENTSSIEMTMIIKEEADITSSTPIQLMPEEIIIDDEIEEQKRKAAERIQKLRNLSFNINSNDPNNEFESVPAYIRKNMELYNTSSTVENFYSNYQVKTDDNNQTQISTINTFLDGKKPD